MLRPSSQHVCLLKAATTTTLALQTHELSEALSNKGRMPVLVVVVCVGRWGGSTAVPLKILSTYLNFYNPSMGRI